MRIYHQGFFEINLGIFLSISVFVLSCGKAQDFLSLGRIKSSSNITYLTQEMVNSSRAKDSSYIVAFKTEPKNIVRYMYGYRSELKSFYSDVFTKIVGSSGVKSINFITSYDTTDNVEGLYYIDRKNPSVKEQLKNVDYIKSLGSHRFSPLDNMVRFKYNSKANYVALAELEFENVEVAKKNIDNWNRRGLIEYAEPNYYSSLYDTESWSSISSSYEGIYSSKYPYWHKKIKLSEAFKKLSEQGRRVIHPIIAVFDSGVDAYHSGLKDHMWRNPQQGVANCGSDDLYGCNTTAKVAGALGNGNVYPIGASGYGTGCSGDSCSHGTHVSGIIAAKFDSGNGGYGGICPVCRIMMIKITEESSKVSDAAIIKGFKYISYFQSETDSEGIVRVVNASLGKPERSRSVGAMVSKMKETPKGKGVLVVAAAGNEATNIYTYMAAFKDTLAVSNIGDSTMGGVGCSSETNYDRRNQTTNYGKWVNIAAPGFCINSTIPGGSVEEKTGTSMASPVVAGVAGLVVSAYPGISFSELKDVLIGSSNSLQLYQYNPDYKMSVPGEDQQYPLLGVGIVDAELAVEKKKSGGNLSIINQERFSSLCGMIRPVRMKIDQNYYEIKNRDFNSYGLSTTVGILFMLVPVFLGMGLILKTREK